MNKGFILVLLFLSVQLCYAQVDKNLQLYKLILSKDSLLFNVSFNQCEIVQFENLFSEHFEFFHDKDSISFKSDFIHNLRNGLCGSKEYQSRRELITGSTEIYPLYNKQHILYGAIQKGNHKFYETISGKKETYAGSAKFTSVWLLEKGNWKLSKCLSFDHKSATAPSEALITLENDIALEKWLKDTNIPTLGIGVINNGKLQQIKVFGKLHGSTPAPYNTIFNVASLTKPVTAMVALRLASKGLWNLNEPLYKYWVDPDVAQDKSLKLLTTRHVLNHQTGFANWRWNNKDGKLRFESTPGTNYKYSGEGFEYLRKAMEKKFKKPLNQLANELVFEPLEMKDTQYFWNNKIDSSRYAVGYDTKVNSYKIVKNKTANAADDLLTTIEDYGKFLISILNGNGLSTQIFEDMAAPHVAIKKNKYFGLGLVRYDLENGEYALSHIGADEGCHTIALVFPKTKNGLIIFTNVDDGYKVYEKFLINYFGTQGKKIIDIETK